MTTPQAGVDGRSFHYARGKTLGGLSARNCMAHHGNEDSDSIVLNILFLTRSRPTVDTLQMCADQVGDDSRNLLP